LKNGASWSPVTDIQAMSLRSSSQETRENHGTPTYGKLKSTARLQLIIADKYLHLWCKVNMHVPYGCTVLFADQGCWNSIERRPDEAFSLQSAALLIADQTQRY